MSIRQANDKIVCRTPTPGKLPTRIDRWKYDVVRAAILEAIPRGPRGVEFRQLSGLVHERIPTRDRERLGSVPWYVSTVKLDLEVRGEIERLPGSRPQRLVRP